ncbi:biotin--[acetyl-CoA-carboxylase] ligase [Iamia majanohamensis]|uniref:biotin--[biotin carboxyl-carrier protein] ligase n=1 Tax=Iamia majanohamensis TaxID=467976 RepID=A0AAE9YCB8_9ACTN|nr:biotin--[acetyl-CoA-carboxylase] ligase [Iamia majanohamensis]WCO68598.1 biotin--[acetyl-CoA-carboxylase] ligase [Iamia majanohamensis]
MTGAPSPFDVDAVRASVAGTRFADVRWVAETGSTNADLWSVATGGGGEGTVLGADHQTAGRGRRGRTWTAPAGAAVLVSVLLRPPAPAVDLATPAVSLAAAEAVEAVCGRAPGIKWPNDLVVVGDGAGPDRKLAGVLAEASWPPGVDIASGYREPSPSVRVPVVVGLGLNVAAEGRDPELEGVAVACDELAGPGVAVGREDLVVAWLGALDRWYGRILDPGGREEMWEAWRARSATLGRRVRVDLGVDDLEGEAVDVTPTGQLVVRTLEGDERVLAVGDVTHLRAV